MNRIELVKKAKAAADQLLKAKGYISLVEVMLAMGRLSKTDYERWRFPQVPHLEKVLSGSLNQHSHLCHQLRAYARDQLKLKPSRTAYVSWGKGARYPLRFSKHGQPHLEELWSTHYVSPALAATKSTPQAETHADDQRGWSECDAARILETLLQRHPELRSEAETLVEEPRRTPSVEEIASDVLARVTGLDIDTLNDRAGAHSWGHVEPREAAEDLLSEAIGDITDEMGYQLKKGLAPEAQATCIGLVLGLYRAREVQSDGALGWAPDWPQSMAEEIVREYVTNQENGIQTSSAGGLMSLLKEVAPNWHGLLQRIVE